MEKKGVLEELYLANKTYPEANIIQRLSPKEYIEVLILHAAKQLGDKFKRLAEENRFDEIIQLTEHISNLVSDHRQEFSLPLSIVFCKQKMQRIAVKNT
ncbi:hypothetical protein [Parageobacillus thermoglucosidasius]|uniref:hypothetical protein n=1 Tax=Parageobacillus thermoglucosidasius TaxID=1426 RepID=UPI0001D184A5|nr:hypothetical protein [Parageobacillus thermoglucosidasius]AEH49269.1 type III restriction protein res subunit [Parageobacillus thermoglucosidasius C56-YS93]